MICLLTSGPALAEDGPEVHRAVVVRVRQAQGIADLPVWAQGAGVQEVTLRFLTGPLRGQELTIRHHLSGNPAFDLQLEEGHRVLVGVERQGGEVVDVYVMDFVRDVPLFWMTGLFVLSLAAVGRLKGVRAVIVLGLTGLAIIHLLIPLVLAGRNPMAVTIGICAGVVVLSLPFIAGLSRKTLAAGVGTVSGLLTAGFLAALFGRLANLQGLGTEEAQMLHFIPNLEIDFRGLLFSGMILGALGAIMDIAMSIASAVEEVRRATEQASFRHLVQSGLNVGRDVLGTMANTLILAYAGGALPLLLLLSAHQVSTVKVLNLDIIATEIVRALSGSIGLVLCVPVTAAVAAYLNRG